MASLEERFQVMKEVGDGSFGSVALARVRTAGAHIARRGTMVWTQRWIINSNSGMKMSFDTDLIVLGRDQNYEEDF